MCFLPKYTFFTEKHRKSFLSTLLVVLLGLLEVSRKGSKGVKSFFRLFSIAAAHYQNADLRNSSVVVPLSLVVV